MAAALLRFFQKNTSPNRPAWLVLIALITLFGVGQASAARKVTFYHTDAQGTVVAASDEEGKLLWRKSYTPYGEQTNEDGAQKETLSYTGKPHDITTGLTYYGARYYDAELGRFVSTDPIGFMEENLMLFNRYAYANNNPYKFVDPDGRSPDIFCVGYCPPISTSSIKNARFTYIGGGARPPARSTTNTNAASNNSTANAKAQTGNKSTKGTGTVFDSVKATQATIKGTSIPKSFELTSEAGKFWVHPNATKHMAEYLMRNGMSHSTSSGSQAMLKSFQQSVNQAASQGIKYGEMMQVGRWELIFSKGRPGDVLPVIKHALYK